MHAPNLEISPVFSATELCQPRSARGRRWLIFGPIIVWLIFVFLSRFDAQILMKLCGEDGLIEDVEAVLLGVASVLSARSARVLFRRRHFWWGGCYALLALLLFFVAGEEISWGQRFLGIPTPKWYARENIQHEITIHNLKSMAPVMTILSTVVPVMLTLVSLFSTQIARRLAKDWQPFLWLPHPIFTSAWLCYLSYQLIRAQFFFSHPETNRIPRVLSKLQEPAEMIVYFAVTVFVIMVWRRLRANGPQGTAGAV